MGCDIKMQKGWSSDSHSIREGEHSIGVHNLGMFNEVINFNPTDIQGGSSSIGKWNITNKTI